MADLRLIDILKQGSQAWNQFRLENPDLEPDLRNADLRDVPLAGADLSRADLSGADFREKNSNSGFIDVGAFRGTSFRFSVMERALFNRRDLRDADFSGAMMAKADLTLANLSGVSGITDLTEAQMVGTTMLGANLSAIPGAGSMAADFTRANCTYMQAGASILNGVDFTGANLQEADLSAASLVAANLRGAWMRQTSFINADLTGANLEGAILQETKLNNAKLIDCRLYGASTWDLEVDSATVQRNLRISPEGQPALTVDDIEIAQFMHLLLNNQKIRRVIDSITSKVVLILGRFTPERKAVLDAMREELKHCNMIPVIFDFEKPSNRDLTETVTTLARMARFIIADITDAKSIPQELEAIVKDLPSVPVQPIILDSQYEYAMFERFRPKRYPWVLEVYRYTDEQGLIGHLAEHVVQPAEAKAKEQTG